MKNLQKLPNHLFHLEMMYRHLIPACNRSDFLFDMNGKDIGNATALNFPDEEWEHVLLEPLTLQRCPSWTEMVKLKNTFWESQDVVIQVHPAKKDYINIQPYTLHQWKKHSFEYDVDTVLETTAELLKDTSKSFHSFESVSHGQRFIAIYGGTRWPSWEEVCAEKQHYFGPNCPAVQYNISPSFDLNDRFLLTVWDASNLPLPPKRLV